MSRLFDEVYWKLSQPKLVTVFFSHSEDKVSTKKGKLQIFFVKDLITLNSLKNSLATTLKMV